MIQNSKCPSPFRPSTISHAPPDQFAHTVLYKCKAVIVVGVGAQCGARGGGHNCILYDVRIHTVTEFRDSRVRARSVLF
jgi:hypothetical protein